MLAILVTPRVCFAGNLIQDGSFEDPNVSGFEYQAIGVHDGDTFGGNGTSGLDSDGDQTGVWHGVGLEAVIADVDPGAYFSTYYKPAYDGDQVYILQAYTVDQSQLWQDVKSLVVGDSYTLSFELNVEQENSAVLTGGVTLNVLSDLSEPASTSALGGEQTVTYDPSGDQAWELEKFTFTATSTSEYVEFGSFAGTQAGVLDSVSLTSNAAPVPEPFTMGLAVAGLAAAVRRRSRARA